MGLKSWCARKAAMFVLSLKVKKPTICVIGGSVGAVGSAVLACVQTARKLDDVLDKHNADMAKIREAKEKSEAGEIDLKKEGIDLKQATAGVYFKTAARAAKVYAVPAIMMAGSIALILYGHHILKSRHALLLAAHTALEDRFKEYRTRVKKAIGDEREECLFHGAEKRIIDEVDPKTGEVKPAEKTVVVDRNANLGDYSFIFDVANSKSWSRRPGANYLFLIAQQNAANEKLQARGYMSLNQVLEMLDMEPVREGQWAGWCWDKKKDIDPPVIDFGILAGANDTNDPGYYQGGSPDYILNFNCSHNLEAYFSKRQLLSSRSRKKIFVKKERKTA